MFKRSYLLIVSVIFALVLKGQEKSFVLKGWLKDMPNNVKLYLVRQDFPSRELDTIGQAISKNGRFRFKGRVDGEVAVHFIRFERDTSKYQPFFQKISSSAKAIPNITIILENRPAIVEGTLEDLVLRKSDGLELIKVNSLPLHEAVKNYCKKYNN